MKNIEVILVNAVSIWFSYLPDIETFLRVAVLIATLTYTIMNIVRRRK